MKYEIACAICVFLVQAFLFCVVSFFAWNWAWFYDLGEQALGDRVFAFVMWAVASGILTVPLVIATCIYLDEKERRP